MPIPKTMKPSADHLTYFNTPRPSARALKTAGYLASSFLYPALPVLPTAYACTQDWPQTLTLSLIAGAGGLVRTSLYLKTLMKGWMQDKLRQDNPEFAKCFYVSPNDL